MPETPTSKDTITETKIVVRNPSRILEKLQPVIHPLQRPYHVRLSNYLKKREEIFANLDCVKLKPKRCTIRLKQFWKNVKKYRKVVISPIVQKLNDNRPHLAISLFDKSYVALLDSGANKSVVGGSLAHSLFLHPDFQKRQGRVKTADGQSQNITGTISCHINYNKRSQPFEFLVVPSIQQNVILGYDFWTEFGLKISVNSSLSFISSIQEDSDNNTFIKLNSSECSELEAAIKFFPSFEKEGLGLTQLVEHRIDTGLATPIKQRHYPISPATEAVLCAEIDRMLALGVIEECVSSPWCNPAVLIVKPGKARFCLDSRKLNLVTLKDAYPMPSIEGLISRLSPIHYISKIDLKDAFWQIALDSESRLKTAFAVPNRPLYNFTRMPFGLCNAPQTMCRLMDKVIPYNLKSFVFVYLDDLLVLSQSFSEHIDHLLEVATCLRRAGLTINVEKSHFALSQVKYLGYIVGQGSLQVDSDKVAAIRDFPCPKSVRQLRQFLGMAGWYRRFIQDFASTTFHLTELLSKKKKFIWTEDAQKSFNLLKEKLISAPLLVHPDYSKPFIVQCDASLHGVGALLAQVDAEGHERPIAFMSQKLNKAQRNYSVTELECLAVVLAIKKYRPYVEGHKFKVITDHASLKWLMNTKDLTGRLARWALKLQGYVFDIEHRKGRQNVVADALSRAHENEPSIDVVDLEIVPSIDLESEEFDSSEYCSLRERYVEADLPDYKVIDKYIYHRVCFSKGEDDESEHWKLFVPPGLRKDVLYAAHDTPSSSHGGIVKTLERVRQSFYWPGLVTDVKNYITKCQVCKTTKSPTHVLKPPMGGSIRTERPFQRLYVDFIGPFPRTRSGNIGMLIILDHFSKFTFLKPVKKFTSSKVIEILQSDIFNCYGVPEYVVSDNGSQFRSKDFEHFLLKYGIKHVCTAVYSPQSNASERVNRSINAALRAYIQKDQRLWDEYVGSVNCSLRKSIHSSVGKSPYEILFGQSMVLHGQDYKLMRELDLLNQPCFELNRSDQLEIIRSGIQEEILKAYNRNAKYYNLRSKPRELKVGQTVYRRNFAQSNLAANFNAKLAPISIKAVINKKLGNHYYELVDEQGKVIGNFHAKDIWQ